MVFVSSVAGCGLFSKIKTKLCEARNQFGIVHDNAIFAAFFCSIKCLVGSADNLLPILQGFAETGNAYADGDGMARTLAGKVLLHRFA